jgi:hypothetical protein
MELWEPWLTPVGAIIVLIVIVRFAFFGSNKDRRPHFVIRTLSILVSVPVVVLAVLSLLMIGCESHGPLIGSPDGRHVARVQVSAALGAVVQPVASVVVRRSWTPAWRNAYVGFGFPGSSETMEPQVKWLDDLHLLITYPAGGEDPTFCRESVGQIVVRCEVETRASRGTEK